MAGADHWVAYIQLPAQEERKKLAAASLRGPQTGKTRGSIPQTQSFGATAAALHYNTLSRAAATIAARWVKIVRMGYFDDFGAIAAESCQGEALKAFAILNEILGFDSKVGQSEWGRALEFPGATASFLFAGGKCLAKLSLSR